MNKFLPSLLRLGALFTLVFVLATSSFAGIEDAPLDDPTVPTLVPPTPAPKQAGAASSTDGATVDASPAPSGIPSFVWQAFYAGLAVAVLCSYLGLFVVARRMVFIGVALAEISSAGIALGLLFGFKPLWGALAFMLLGVVLFSRRWAHRRLPPDAVIGVFYTIASALGILLIAKSPKGESEMLNLLRGNILTVDPLETWEMIGVFVGVGLLHALFAKEFLLVSLDRDTASTLRFNAARWEFLLFLTIGIVVSLSIRSVGVLLTSAMFIMPAATALLLMPRWKAAATLAPILGAAAVAIGLWLSLVGDFPASAVIVAVSFVIMLPALVWHTFVRRS